MNIAWNDAHRELFAQSFLGASLGRDDARCLTDLLALERRGGGDVLFSEGDHGGFLAVLLSGEVEIRKEGRDAMETHVVTLGSGSHFGDMSLLDGESRSASAVTASDVVLAVLSPSDLERLLAERPALGIKVLGFLTRALSQRLRLATSRLVGLT